MIFPSQKMTPNIILGHKIVLFLNLTVSASHSYLASCNVKRSQPLLKYLYYSIHGLGDFNIGGQIIQTVKYADDLVLMDKEETVLLGMIDKLFEIGRCCGMEMNVEKTKAMRISRQPSPVTIMIDKKQLENVECFKYLGSMLTNDGRFTREIKSRTAMAKDAFNNKKTLFTSTLDLNLRKKLVKC